jgi:hypothetical protein
MSSFLKIASGVLLPLALVGCVAERADDEAIDPSASESVGEAVQADSSPTPPASTTTTTTTTLAPCPKDGTVVIGPTGAPLVGPYACAALAAGTTPTVGGLPGIGYYPGFYGPGYYPSSYGLGYYPGLYGPGYHPSGFGYGYYPGLGYPPGYYPGFGLGPSGPLQATPCSCPPTTP